MSADFEVVSQIELLDGTMFPLYSLQPKQMEAYRLTPFFKTTGEYPRHIGYGGAAGGGKSYLARAVALSAALIWPKSRSIIFRLTKQEVIDNHVTYFMDEVPEKLPDGRRLYSYNGEQMVSTFTNGSRIYFGYLKEFSDVKRYQGNQYDVMIFEEATHYGFDEVRWLSGNRNRANTDDSRPFCLYPSNPGNKGHHWYKRLFIERDFDPDAAELPRNYVFVQAKVTDNKVLLDRDPGYLRELDTMPEPHRSWMRDGNWEAGLGLALPQLDRARHIVDDFVPPPHWPIFASFDWGYAHPFSFGLYTVNEDRRVFKMETITGRMLQPQEIAAKVQVHLDRLKIPMSRIRHIIAGHDVWADVKARAENIPTIAEHLREWGWRMVPAHTSRISGLNNLRKFLSWKDVYPGGGDDLPYLMFMDTKGNRECYKQLATLAADPNNPEDAEKRDADSFGRGGDDSYDETRYALASRQMPARSRFDINEEAGGWSDASLRQEYERKMKGKPLGPIEEDDTPLIHPEFGVMF